ncbi:MAG: hypothetical protein WCO53_13150 [Deltaproteobacteria bacterium]
METTVFVPRGFTQMMEVAAGLVDLKNMTIEPIRTPSLKLQETSA